MINWTDYLRHRAKIRGLDLEKLEHIIRHSSERYFDTETRRAMSLSEDMVTNWS